MKRFPIQHFWNLAWKRFRQNFVAAVTLIPVSSLVGAFLAWMGVAGIWLSVKSCESRTEAYERKAKEGLEKISMPTDNYFYQQAYLALEEEQQSEYVDKEDIVRRALKIADSTEEALSAEKKKIEAVLAGTNIQELKDSIRKALVDKIEEKKRRIEEATRKYLAKGQLDSAYQDPYFRQFYQETFYPPFEADAAAWVPEDDKEKADRILESLDRAY